MKKIDTKVDEKHTKSSEKHTKLNKKFEKTSFDDLKTILNILSQEIVPELELEAGDDIYVLLVSVVLSAQATDVSVNKVLPGLFNHDKTSNIIKCNDEYTIDKSNIDYINSLTVAEIENKIKTIGLFRNKAKNISKLTEIILQKHNYNIPSSREDLEELPGVGRKSANIILNVVFGQPTVPVDTHVFRLAHRLGLSNEKNVLKVERDIVAYFDVNSKNKYDMLKNLHYYFVLHGRYVCVARKPRCDKCNLRDVCKFYKDQQLINDVLI